MQPTNLNDYYKSIGQALPTVQERAKDAASLGVQGTYTGTAQQNQQYLQGLLNKAKSSASSPIPMSQIINNQAGSTQTTNTAGTTGAVNPAQPIQLPAANISQATQQPDYVSQLLQGVTQQETELQKQYGSIANKIANLVPELGGEQQMLAQEQQKAGVFKLKQDLQNINNQITLKTAELNKDDITLANSLQQIEDKPIAMEFITGQQSSIQRNAQLQRAMKSAEIGMLNAQALAAQGNISLAMQTAQNAVDAKYTPLKESLDLYQKQLAALEPLLNREEKRLAEERDLRVKVALSDLDYRRQNESDIQKLIVNAASQGADQAKLLKASQAKTPMDAAIALGAYGENYYKLQQLKAESKALNAGNYSTSTIPPGQLTKDTGFTVDDYMRGIAGVESGGQASPYTAIGPTVTSGMYKGDHAYGKYQVMGKNIPQWTKEAFGRAMSIQEFLASPDKQDALIRYQAEKNYAKYGNWDDVAAVWFSGSPLAGNVKSDVLGTTTPDYVNKMRMKAMGGSTPQTQIFDSETQNFATALIKGEMDISNIPADKRSKVLMAKETILSDNSFESPAARSVAMGIVSPGQIVSATTGLPVKSVSASQIDGLAALRDLSTKVEEYKSLFEVYNESAPIGSGIIRGSLNTVLPSTTVSQLNSLRSEIVDLLARARSGAALTAYETAQYEDKLPGIFNNSIGIGASGVTKIDSLLKSFNGTLNSKLQSQGLTIAPGMNKPVSLTDWANKADQTMTNTQSSNNYGYK